jgi:Kdo2-lipid IVA lauroyltransferase/acyltransferase
MRGDELKGLLFRLAFGYARFYAIFCYWRKKARRREIEEKFRFFLAEKISPEQLRKIVRHIFELRGTRKVMDYLIPLLDDRLIERFFTVEGLHHLDGALKEGKGVVLLSGHLGNPHLGFCTVRVMGYDLILIKGGPPGKKGRSRFHYSETPEDTIFIHDPSLAPEYKKRILETLEQGKVLQYFQDTREGKSRETVSFLGRQIDFPTGIIHLAHQTKATVIPCIHLYHRGKITIIFKEPIDRGWKNGKEEYRRIVSEFAKTLETYILRYPEQYMGIYGPTVLSEYFRLHGEARLGRE